MEREKAQEISSSILWTEICKELDLWIDAEIRKLVSCMPEAVIGHQQTIRDFQRVKALPQIVQDREE